MIEKLSNPVNPVVINAMSVDVEDYYQVSAFEDVVDRLDWANHESRVVQNVERILELFERHQCRATFFTLGCIAQENPSMVKRIVEHGHELGSHGWQHTRVTEQTPQEFRRDVGKTKAFLEDLSGTPVKGYRAASYSINGSNLWAWDELADAGYEYSSSIVPIRHDLYGMPDASRFPFWTAGNRLLEIPVTTVRFGGRNINCGGGGWFRLFPYTLSRWALRQFNNEDASALFYFHPWEIDPGQPRVKGIGWRARFRHYLNLNGNYERIERLFSDFRWSRMDEVFLEGQNSHEY